MVLVPQNIHHLVENWLHLVHVKGGLEVLSAPNFLVRVVIIQQRLTFPVYVDLVLDDMNGH